MMKKVGFDERDVKKPKRQRYNVEIITYHLLWPFRPRTTVFLAAMPGL